jgi:hypothetical protein
MIGRVAAVLACALFAASGAAASEQAGSPDFTCKLSHAATMVDSLKALPPAVAKALHVKVGDMAERGGAFNATDVIMDPNAAGRRFIRAAHAGAKWVVWYEQGGVAYFKAIVVFEADGNGALFASAEYQGNWNDNMCADTDKILDGRLHAH